MSVASRPLVALALALALAGALAGALAMPAAAGCGAAPGPAAVPGPSARRTPPAPVAPVTRYGVAPAELGDPDIDARLVHRARLLDGATLRIGDGEAPGLRVSNGFVWTVGGERGDSIRVVLHEDGARLMAWVPRVQVAAAVVAAVQLGDRAGTVASTRRGVWLAPGARATLSTVVDGRHLAVLDEGDLQARGWIPAAAVGQVWVEGPAPWASAEEARAGRVRLLGPTPVRVAPDAGAEMVATLGAARDGATEVLDEWHRNADVVPPAPGEAPVPAGWTELEVADNDVRVRGFVPTRALVADDLGGMWLMGHGDAIEELPPGKAASSVPAGACLFARAGGEVVGVAWVARRRAVAGDPAQPAWPRVAVRTAWGALEVRLHLEAGTLGGGDARFERCGRS